MPENTRMNPRSIVAEANANPTSGKVVVYKSYIKVVRRGGCSPISIKGKANMLNSCTPLRISDIPMKLLRFGNVM